jgi:hypothetical protein
MTRPEFLAAGFCACLTIPAAVAAEEPVSDLRGVTIGMSVQEIPTFGYRNLSCVGAASQPLENWSDWKSCTVGPDGLRGVHLDYDQPGQDATLVAGHPVDLSVFFDDSGRLVRIEIKTQDHTSLYMRKKAHLLARQAMEHYGDDGWNCRNTPPSANEEAIGPTYVNETCSKTFGKRSIDVTSRFFHKAGGGQSDFVSDSLVVVKFRPHGSD